MGHMVRSPKTGRELESAHSYTGPKWLGDLAAGETTVREIIKPYLTKLYL